jgi:hypothetical protein
MKPISLPHYDGENMMHNMVRTSHLQASVSRFGADPLGKSEAS